jgi:hypothetical protein
MGLMLFLLALAVSANAPVGNPTTTDSTSYDLPRDAAILADPGFKPASLSPEMQLWHDRMLDAMRTSATTIDGRSRSGNLYELGRYLNDYTTALLNALRATGDARFLDRAAQLWDQSRPKLADAWLDGTKDGYVNWLWLQTPGDFHYGKDLHSMDEAMTHGSVAALAYALHQNRNLSSSYASRADFWTDYLEKHFLAKWNKRANGSVAAWESNAGFYKRLTHPRSNQLRIAHYLHRITDKTFYKERAEVIARELCQHMENHPKKPGAYQWKHELDGGGTFQKINYAHYFMNVVIDMHLEGYGLYAQNSEMEKYMRTFRDVVLPKVGHPWSQMAERVDGSGTYSYPLYGLSGFARWDSTGYLLQAAETRYSADKAGYGVAVAAGALLSLSGPTAASAPPLSAPENLRVVTID